MNSEENYGRDTKTSSGEEKTMARHGTKIERSAQYKTSSRAANIRYQEVNYAMLLGSQITG